jgi:hypothetical protein
VKSSGSRSSVSVLVLIAPSLGVLGADGVRHDNGINEGSESRHSGTMCMRVSLTDTKSSVAGLSTKKEVQSQLHEGQSSDAGH